MINLYQITVEDNFNNHCEVIYDELFKSDSIEKVKIKAQEIINVYVLDEYYTLEDADEDGVDYKIIWENFEEDVIGYYCKHLLSTITIKTKQNIEELKNAKIP